MLQAKFQMKTTHPYMEVLVDLKSGGEHVSEEALAIQQACILALTSCSYLEANSSLCLLTDSLADAWIERGTCQNYPRGPGGSTNNAATDGER